MAPLQLLLPGKAATFSRAEFVNSKMVYLNFSPQSSSLVLNTAPWEAEAALCL